MNYGYMLEATLYSISYDLTWVQDDDNSYQRQYDWNEDTCSKIGMFTVLCKEEEEINLRTLCYSLVSYLRQGGNKLNFINYIRETSEYMEYSVIEHPSNKTEYSYLRKLSDNKFLLEKCGAPEYLIEVSL